MRDVGDDQRVRRGAVRCRHLRGLEPIRRTGGNALLKKRLAAGALGKALKEGGSARGGHSQRVSDLEVVRHEFELRGADTRKVDLVGTRDLDDVSFDLDATGLFGRHIFENTEACQISGG